MPYCRKCGTQLRDDAKFCYHCGNPVIPITETYEVPRVVRRTSYLSVSILIGIIIGVIILGTIIIIPIMPFNSNVANEVSLPNVNQLNLNFHANIAQVNVIMTNSTGKTLLMNVSGTGLTSILAPNPIVVSFNNYTVNNVLTVTTTISDSWPSLGNQRLTCDIYIDPSIMNIQVSSSVSQIRLCADAETTLHNFDLIVMTGNTQVTFDKNVTLTSNISLSTTTGSVSLILNQPKILGNVTINLNSNSGVIYFSATELQKLSGNIQVNAATSAGSIDVGLFITGDVGARIESQTNLGSTVLNIQGFSGTKSSMQSDNYPDDSNILVNLRTNLGTITIQATYQTENI